MCTGHALQSENASLLGILLRWKLQCRRRTSAGRCRCAGCAQQQCPGAMRTLRVFLKRDVVAEPVMTRSMLFSSRNSTRPCFASSCMVMRAGEHRTQLARIT